jgi:hypothetical protein
VLVLRHWSILWIEYGGIIYLWFHGVLSATGISTIHPRYRKRYEFSCVMNYGVKVSFGNVIPHRLVSDRNPRVLARAAKNLRLVFGSHIWVLYNIVDVQI